MDTLLQKIFNGRRVFLTGHTGFKGAWLVALLDLLGAKTTAYALPPETVPACYDKINGSTLCDSIVGDLRDRAKLTESLKQACPNVVLHLAAQSLVRRSYRDPIETFESNVTGTLNLLEAVRQYGRPCAVTLITTDKVYAESGTGLPYREDDKLGGYDPYSTSKACCELLASSYRSSYFHPSKFAQHGVSIATARAGNVIGGGDWCEDRLLPDVVRAMSRGEAVRVRNPRAVRPWQHVLEPLCGYLRLAAHQLKDGQRFADGFNFGPSAGDTLEVEQVVKTALDAWGSGTYFCDVDPNAPHEAALLRLDSSKANASLDWRPRYDARTAISKTVEWYRFADADPLGYTRNQIKEYLAA